MAELQRLGRTPRGQLQLSVLVFDRRRMISSVSILTETTRAPSSRTIAISSQSIAAASIDAKSARFLNSPRIIDTERILALTALNIGVSLAAV